MFLSLQEYVFSLTCVVTGRNHVHNQMPRFLNHGTYSSFSFQINCTPKWLSINNYLLTSHAIIHLLCSFWTKFNHNVVIPFWPEWIQCFLLLYYCFLQLLFMWIFFVLFVEHCFQSIWHDRQRTKNNLFFKHSDIYNISRVTLLKFMCLILFILVVILLGSCQENCKTTKKKNPMKFSQSSSHKNMKKNLKKIMCILNRSLKDEATSQNQVTNLSRIIRQ